MNILFTCAGRRNYLLRYFREELEGLTDIDYIPSLLELCENSKIDLIISLNDVELPILAEKKRDFERKGTKLLVSSKEIIDICFDKLKTCEFLQKNKLRYPQTFVELDSAEDALLKKKVRFPLFVKPRWGSASLQIFRVDTLDELRLAFKLAKIQLQKTFLKVENEFANQSILIQEGLPGAEYGIDILNDLDGNVHSVYVKKKLGMRAGETDKSELVDVPALYNLGEELGAGKQRLYWK